MRAWRQQLMLLPACAALLLLPGFLLPTGLVCVTSCYPCRTQQQQQHLLLLLLLLLPSMLNSKPQAQACSLTTAKFQDWSSQGFWMHA
jgi:hypothetical protein